MGSCGFTMFWGELDAFSLIFATILFNLDISANSEIAIISVYLRISFYFSVLIHLVVAIEFVHLCGVPFSLQLIEDFPLEKKFPCAGKTCRALFHVSWDKTRQDMNKRSKCLLGVPLPTDLLEPARYT